MEGMKSFFSPNIRKEHDSVPLDFLEKDGLIRNPLSEINNSLDSNSNTKNYLRASILKSDQSRKLEDVDYWRKRAGWFDDDEAMKAYNEGVYDTFYSTDDAAGGGSGKSAASKIFSFFGSSEIISTSLKVFGSILGVATVILLIRALKRRSQSRKKNRKISSLIPESGAAPNSASKASSSRKRSSSRSRSRSKSKLGRSRSSRSRSRRRKAEKDTSGTEDEGKAYALMEDGEGGGSRSSKRSKSRDKKRSSSRSRRSRSRSRAARQDSARETMLV